MRTANGGRFTLYWRIVCVGMLTGLVCNLVLTAVFFAMTVPSSWGEVVARALGLATALTFASTIFVVVTTIWYLHDLASRARRVLFLAFLGPALGWTLLGLMIADWLLPIYAVYGLASGVGYITIFALGLRRSRRLGPMPTG